MRTIVAERSTFRVRMYQLGERCSSPTNGDGEVSWGSLGFRGGDAAGISLR